MRERREVVLADSPRTTASTAALRRGKEGAMTLDEVEEVITPVSGTCSTPAIASTAAPVNGGRERERACVGERREVVLADSPRTTASTAALRRGKEEAMTLDEVEEVITPAPETPNPRHSSLHHKTQNQNSEP